VKEARRPGPWLRREFAQRRLTPGSKSTLGTQRRLRPLAEGSVWRELGPPGRPRGSSHANAT